MSNKYQKPQVKTMTVHEILETLGPVSCGSGSALGGHVDSNVGAPAGADGLNHLN